MRIITQYNDNSQSFFYNGHLMTIADGNPLDYDENGQLTSGIGTSLVWNWDNKLRSATKGNTAINLKYDPAGNRIAKDVNVSQTVTARKYIVDVVGDLPVILLELQPTGGSFEVKKAYIYANSQILMQHNGVPATDNKYFYLHDRLGSVRQLINQNGAVVRFYTYNPFGELLESGHESQATSNCFMFSGQFFDDEIGQYYLRARQYDPYISRFISCDPVFGKFEEPLTLHKYLYCQNEPISRTDPMGLLYVPVGGPKYDWKTTQDVINKATEMVGTDFINGPIEAFGFRGRGGEFDYKFTPFTFQLTRHSRVTGSEFSNWLAGYTCYYNYGLAGELGARGAGHSWALEEDKRLDEPSSKYFISAGVLKGMADRRAEGKRSSFDMADFVYNKFELMRYGYDRITEGEFERDGQMVSADLGGNEWWDQMIIYTEFWNSGTRF